MQIVNCIYFLSIKYLYENSNTDIAKYCLIRLSEWKKNHTNPTSDKIMPICKTLKVSPEWLLSGIDRAGNKRKKGDYLIIEKDTEIWTLVEQYKSLDKGSRDRILGYVEAFATLKVKEI